MQLLTESAGIDFFGQRKRKHFSILCSEGIKSQSTAGGTFLNSTYGFDAARGNLTYRKDNRRNKQENFTYDNLNRLKTYGGIVMDYDPKGNITKKGDVGTFHYQTPHKPYALSGADIGTNKVIPPREQTIRYTSFDRPSVITENGYEASFIYNASGDRQKMTVKKGGKPLYTRYYLGGRYEMDVMGNSQKHRLYIGGDAYTAPAVYMNTGNGWALYYICRDYLGNMTHLVNRNGTVVQELSYDAWGRLRNPETHAVYLPDNETELLLGRGYTGHEHLPMFGLINMNARLYDPVLGRFLSPDPYVQMPDFSQNFNRYSYCLNNPLVYVDESGEYAIIDDIIAAVIGGVVNLAVNIVQGNIKGDFWTVLGHGAAAFGSGAVAGFGALYPELGGWIWGGATVGATNAWLGGAKGWDIAIGGGVGIVSSYAGGIAGQWGARYLGGAIINGTSISSPVLQGAITGTIGEATGGYAGGFATNLILTGSIKEANQAGLNGAIFGAPIGGVSGSMSVYKYARQNNMNPWTGKPISTNPTFQYDFSLDPFGDNVTLYRGLTGSEGKEGFLFMTDNPSYAESYVKNGGKVVSTTISRGTLFRMQMDGVLTIGTHPQINAINGMSGIEYMFYDKVKPQIVSRFKYW